MKKILITGLNSFVGNSFEKWINNYSDKYIVEKISLRDSAWREKDLSIYDSIVHVAGIAHVKESKKNKDLYYKINRDLTYEIALKSKKDGVPQFIFLSSMSVYGMETGVITFKSIPKPKTHYGKSKLEAEKLLESLTDENFKLAIIRPPMIYGKGCKGNYVKLANLAVKTPIFPNVQNSRSMIYIDNLSIYLKYIIDNNCDGIFFPQNEEYVNTSELVKLIAHIHGKKIIMTRIFNPIIRSMENNRTIRKVFGSLVYEKNMSNNYELSLINFKDTIKLTEL